MCWRRYGCRKGARHCRTPGKRRPFARLRGNGLLRARASASTSALTAPTALTAQTVCACPRPAHACLTLLVHKPARADVPVQGYGVAAFVTRRLSLLANCVCVRAGVRACFCAFVSICLSLPPSLLLALARSLSLALCACIVQMRGLQTAARASSGVVRARRPADPPYKRSTRVVGGGFRVSGIGFRV